MLCAVEEDFFFVKYVTKTWFLIKLVEQHEKRQIYEIPFTKIFWIIHI